MENITTETTDVIKKSKLSQSFSTLTSSKQIWDYRKILWPLTLLLLIVGAIVSSVAHMAPMWNRSYESIVHNHPKLELAMSELFDKDLDCTISSSEDKITCNNWNDFEVTGYKVTFQEEGYNLEDVKESQIIFTENLFGVLTVVPDEVEDHRFFFSGDYSTLAADFSFTKFYNDNKDKADKDAIYKAQTKNMIRGVYLSTLPTRSITILSANSLQHVITVFVISLVFLMLNFRSHKKIIKFYEAFVSVTIIALWAGFLSAFIALLNVTLGSVTFYSVISLKAVFMYVYLLKEKRAMGVAGM